MTRAADRAADRRLAWDGCFNVRDLGGLPAAGGHTVRRGALVRADALDRLTAAGWRALEATACARSSTCATTTFLAELDLEARLRAAGLSDADLDALRTRILAPAPAPA